MSSFSNTPSLPVRSPISWVMVWAFIMASPARRQVLWGQWHLALVYHFPLLGQWWHQAQVIDKNHENKHGSESGGTERKKPRGTETWEMWWYWDLTWIFQSRIQSLASFCMKRTLVFPPLFFIFLSLFFKLSLKKYNTCGWMWSWHLRRPGKLCMQIGVMLSCTIKQQPWMC